MEEKGKLFEWVRRSQRATVLKGFRLPIQYDESAGQFAEVAS